MRRRVARPEVPGDLAAPTVAMLTIVGMLDDLEESVEFRDSLIPRILPGANVAPTTC